MREIGAQLNTMNSTITMRDESVMLGEAVVTAKAIEVQVKNDTIEYNADSYKIGQKNSVAVVMIAVVLMRSGSFRICTRYSGELW